MRTKTRSDYFIEIKGRAEFVRRKQRLPKNLFAARLGMSPATYNNYTGKQDSKPSVAMVIAICNVFNIAPTWMLFGKGTMEWVPSTSADQEREA